MKKFVFEIKSFCLLYRKVYVDFIALLSTIFITLVLILSFGLCDKFFRVSQQHEYLKLDSIAFFLASISLFLLIFVLRRLVEFKSLLSRAYTDPLIGIFNRRRGSELIYNQLNQRKNSKKSSIIMFDIDNFKSINDIYGHNSGDYVLKKIVSILQDQSRFSDIFIRWGGEEFIILCLDTSLNEAKELAERFRITIEKHRFLKLPVVTASFGVTSLNEYEDLTVLLARVDENMYISKQQGKNLVTTK